MALSIRLLLTGFLLLFYFYILEGVEVGPGGFMENVVTPCNKREIGVDRAVDISVDADKSIHRALSPE